MNKILIFTYGNMTGGVSRFIETLISTWPEAEDKIVLYINETHPSRDRFQESIGRRTEIKEYFNEIDTLTQRHVSTPTRVLLRAIDYCHLWAMRVPCFIKEFVELLKEECFTHLLVVNGGYPGSLSCRVALMCWNLLYSKNPSVHNIHNLNMPSKGPAGLVDRIIDRILSSSRTEIVGVSQACIESLKERRAYRSSRRMSYILNGIVEWTVNHRGESCSQGRNDKHIICTMLANYEPRKGHLIALKAFSQAFNVNPNLRLFFYGSGTESEIGYLKRYIDIEGLGSVVTVGPYTQSPERIYEESDIVLLTSRSHESFGLVLVEAMMHSKPVIASRIGGIPEVVKDNLTGFLCTRDETTEFAKRILELANSKELRYSMGQMGRQRFEDKFRAERMSSEYRLALIRQQEN